MGALLGRFIEWDGPERYEPYRMVAAMVIIQAIRDLNHRSKRVRLDAMRFLVSKESRFYAELLDVEPTLPQLALLLRAREDDFSEIEMPREMAQEALRLRERHGSGRGTH